MAFADEGKAFADGEETSGLSLTQAAVNAVFANQGGAGEKLLTVLKTLF
jgi:hypothetical protein